MRVLVVKFGGTSVRYGHNNIIKIIEKYKQSWDKIIVVVSALSQVTNMLLTGINNAKNNLSTVDTIANIFNAHLEILLTNYKKKEIQDYLTEYQEICSTIKILGEISPRVEAKVSSYGELMSLSTIEDIFISNNIQHGKIESLRFIMTDSNYLDALVNIEKTQDLVDINLKTLLSTNDIVLTNGFLAMDKCGDITTLGRGGSDYTATLIGNMVGAKEVHIYSDVDGIMSGDPKKIKNAFVLSSINVTEASELSFFGGKILHPKTVQPIQYNNTILKVLNTFSDKNGTIIASNIRNDKPIIAVTSISNMSLITVEGNGILGRVGIASRFFDAISNINVNIPFITQASSETSICIAINDIYTDKVIDVTSEKLKKEIDCGYIQNISHKKDVALITTIIGSNMNKTPGIAGKIFSALGDNHINIVAISQGSSRISITIVVDMMDEIDTLNIIHNLII
jgi:aspartate kinase